MFQEENNPLVSIVVVTYNSSKYVIETLESAKNQTYKNIELIVSDDCSSDNTVEICKNWIENNKKNFINTELITVNKNTGIPANCNRGLYLSKGKWIKFIAGDDALLNTCIDDNLLKINEIDQEVYALHSEVLLYSEFLDNSNFISKSNVSSLLISNNLINAKEQLELFVRGQIPLAPSVFFYRPALLLLKGFDEKLPYEDIPMWIKFAENNFKIHFLNKATVKYRICDSVSNSKNLIFNLVYKMGEKVYEETRKKHLTFLEKISLESTYLIKDWFVKINLINANFMNNLLFKSLNFPFYNLYRLINKFYILKIKFSIFKRKHIK